MTVTMSLLCMLLLPKTPSNPDAVHMFRLLVQWVMVGPKTFKSNE